MDLAFSIVCPLLTLFMLAILARVLLSWFPFNPRGFMATVAGFLYFVTDPVMGRLRRVLPPARFGGVALDFSPMVAIFGIIIVQELLC